MLTFLVVAIDVDKTAGKTRISIEWTQSCCNSVMEHKNKLVVAQCDDLVKYVVKKARFSVERICVDAKPTQSCCNSQMGFVVEIDFESGDHLMVVVLINAAVNGSGNHLRLPLYIFRWCLFSHPGPSGTVLHVRQA